MATNPFDEFDVGARRESNPFDEFDTAPIKPSRSTAIWLKDLGASALSGLTGAAKLPAAAIDRAVSGEWYGPGVQALGEFGESVDAQKSADLQRREQERQNVIKNVGGVAQRLVGGGDGELATAAREIGEAGASAATLMSDPVLLANAFATQLGLLGVTRIGGRVGDAAGEGLKRLAPAAAATKIGQAGVAGAGTAGAVGTGALLQGVDIGSETQQQLASLPDALWAKIPEFQALSQQMGPDAAKARLINDKAFMATAQAGLASVLSSMLPGGAAMERALAGKMPPGAKLSAAAKAFGTEARQEGIEEGFGRMATNEAVGSVDPSRGLWQGVGAAAGEGAALGGMMGGAMTAGRMALDARSPQAPAAPADRPAAPAEAAPARVKPTAGRAPSPDIRLAELELAAQQRSLSPAEQAELRRLSEGVDAAASEADETDAPPARAPATAAAPRRGRIAPGTSFARFVEVSGIDPSAVEIGSPQWAALRSQFDEERSGGDRSSAAAAPAGTPEASPAAPMRAPAPDGDSGMVGQPADPIAGAELGTASSPFGPDPALQNRDRTRAASVAQMADIARSPDYARLGISRTPESGAPMVFAVGDLLTRIPHENLGLPDVAVMSDGQRVPFRYAVVDASQVEPSNFHDGTPNPLFNSTAPGLLKALNNGRTAGVRAAHENGWAGGYVDELKADAASHGVPLDAIERTPNPMLVRVYSEQSNTADMAARSQGQALGMSASEQARQDAALIDESVLAVHVPGETSSPANRDFVRAFVGRARSAGLDVATLMTDDGILSADGRRRLDAALLQLAYGQADLVAEMFEATDTDMRSIGEALKAAAGEWAGMRAAAARGAISPAVDVTDNLVQAVNLVRKARRERTSLHDLVMQPDILTGEAPDLLTIGWLRAFYPSRYYTRAASRERVIEALRDYTRGAMTTTDGADLLGETVTPDDILRTINDRAQFPAGAIYDQSALQAEPSSRRNQPASSGDPVGGAAQAGARVGQQRASEDGAGPGRGRIAAAAAGSPAALTRAAVEAAAADPGRFPPVSEITGMSVGPGGRITPRPIAPGALLYRETNLSGLDDLLRLDAQADVRSMYVTDRRELALGQGDNRGVPVTFRPDALSGREHRKPMTGDITGREYATDLVAPRAVLSFEIDADAVRQLRGLTRRRLREFERTALADGRVRFDRRMGADTASAADSIEERRADAVERARDALGDLAQVLSSHTRAAMVPEDTPGLMPALVELFDAAFDIVGTDLQRATAWVKEQLKGNPRTKPLWNKVATQTYRKAAEQALARRGSDAGAQAGLFGADELPTLPTTDLEDSLQGDLLAQPLPTGRPSAQRAEPPAASAAPAPVTPAAAVPRRPADAGPIQDAGEKIGGARKDRWAERGLNTSDLDDMSEAEGATLVNKANVWKPDYAALVADGMHAEAAAMVKVIVDSLAAKPRENTPQGRRDYVRAMQAVRKVYGAVKTPQEAKDAYQQLRTELGVRVAFGDGSGWRETRDPEARRVLFSVYKGRSDPFVLGYNEIARARRLVVDGFPGAVEPWTRRLVVRAVGGEGLTERGFELYEAEAAKLGTPVSREQLRAGAWQVRDKAGKTLAYAATKADAEASAKAIYERAREGGSSLLDPERPHLDRVVRSGLPQSLDRDATPEDFISTFGFRGIEFGNWAAQDERQKVLNLAYDALADLARVLKLPLRALSLDGTLGMAFGARGGGRFAAHYEPGKLVINMTKLRGAGSLSHEWAHGFDHYLGELDRSDAYKTGARGASGWYSEARYEGKPEPRMVRGADGRWVNTTQMRMANLRPELAQRIDAVMSALYKGQQDKAAMLAEMDATIARVERYANDERADAQLRAMYRRQIENYRAARAEIASDPDGTTYPKGRSQFAAEAQKLSGKSTSGYWLRPTEMFARAFEAYVFDRIVAMGARSDYLVHGVEAERYAGEGYRGNPYPTGAERAAINRAFDALVDELKTRPSPDGGLAIHEQSSTYGVAAAERAVYPVNEPGATADVPLDLFPDTLDDLQAVPGQRRDAGAGARRKAADDGHLRPAGAVPGGTVQPNTLAIRQDAALPGTYHFSSQLVEVGRRELPVARVTNWQEAASALQALRRYAVEHFDVLVTDDAGKPLAVVGAFKGAQSQAAVYPATILQEALRIEGAARLWGVHNHPSGAESLSRADEFLNRSLAAVFGPSSLRWMGLAAVGNSRFEAVADPKSEARQNGTLLKGGAKVSVPIVERTIAPNNDGMPMIGTPAEARLLVTALSGGRPGVLFTDAQLRVTAFVPLEPSSLGTLRQDGRFDRLINSAAEAGASSALVANPGEVIGTRALANLANALSLADVRMVDAIDTASGRSAAEAGTLPGGGGTVFSRAPQVRTPAFRRWFGRSRIVDAQGTPRVMYHGTGADITAFRAQQAGAIFVTEEPLFAHAYADTSAKWLRDRGQDAGANVLPVYVKAERPFDYENLAHRREVMADILRGPDSVTRPDGKAAVRDADGRATLWDADVLESGLVDPAGDGNWLLIEQPWFQRSLRRLGFDGFYVSEAGFKNLAVYEPTQLKSTIGNRGSFDPLDADLRLSDARGSSGAEVGAGAGVTTAALDAMAVKVAAALPGLPKVNVLASPQALTREGAQGRLHALITERGAQADAEGALHEGEIYLFASNLASLERAEFVLAQHEAAHAGLRGLLGERMPRVLQAMLNQDAKLRREAAALLKSDPGLTMLEAAEEVLVDMPTSELVRLRGWRQMVAAMRDWFAAHGFERLAQRLGDLLDGTLDQQQRADLLAADLVRAARAHAAGATRSAGAAASLERRAGARSTSSAERTRWMDAEARTRGFKDAADLEQRSAQVAARLAAAWERRTGGAGPTRVDGAPASATARAVLSRSPRQSETESGRPLPEPTPEDGNRWSRLKARVMALTDPKALDGLIYEFQDKFVDLRRLRDRLAAGQGTITDLNDAYLGEELYHKRLATRTDDFLRDELKPLLEDLNARGITLQDFEQFLHARHAPEANAVLAERNPTAAQLEEMRDAARKAERDLAAQLTHAQRKGSATRAIEDSLAQARTETQRLAMAQAFKGTEAERLSLSGMSDEQAQSLMAGLAPERRRHMEALAARVDAINARTLKLLEDYGLMSREALDAWRQTYRHYVPLHRDEAHADSHAHPIGTGFSVKGEAARSRVGSNAKVTHILGHLAMQREAALTRGEKNNVIKKLYLMAAQNPDPKFWSVERLPTVKTLDPATGFVRTGVDPRYKNLPNVLMLRLGGRDVAITFNERDPQALRLAEAMKNLDVGDLHVALSLVAKGTRWFAAVNTQYNPIFGLINFARDLQAGLLNLSTTPLAGQQKAVAANVLKAMRAIYRTERGKSATDATWSALWRDLQEVGGTTGYRDLFTDAADRTKQLEKQLASLERGKVSEAAHAIVDWLSDYNETMENAVRLSAYKAALDQGMSRERAASLAKNLTVNFNRKGRQAREIGALYAFFNASLQGTARMAQTLAGPTGRRIMLGGVALGMANTLLGLAMMGGGDDDDAWGRIPDFVKERSLVIPLGREDFLAIPMPLGFHVFPNIGRVAVETAFGHGDKSAGRRIGELLMTTVDAFNPLGGAQNVGQMVAPTVIDPVVALMENKDWTGRPIYREQPNSLDPRPGHTMAKDSASTVGRGLAAAINRVTGGTEYRPGAWSPTPDQLDYVMGQLTGGLGRELLKVNQTVAAPFTGDELPAHKVPLLGRVYGNTRGTAGHSGKFYENVRMLNELENEVDGRRRNQGDVDGFRTEEPLTALIGRGNVVERRVRELQRQRRAVAERAEDGYRERVKEIDARIAEVMASFNAEVLSARRNAAVAAN